MLDSCKIKRFCRWAACVSLLFTALPIENSWGQGRWLQLTAAAWPGVGAQVVYVQARRMYTFEALAYADFLPWQDRNPLYVSTGVGAAIRPLGVIRTIGGANFAYDVDLGIRTGPTLTFIQDPTRADKNRQFSLFLDPFVRLELHALDRTTLVLEVGAQRPSFRLGVWLGLP